MNLIFLLQIRNIFKFDFSFFASIIVVFLLLVGNVVLLLLWHQSEPQSKRFMYEKNILASFHLAAPRGEFGYHFFAVAEGWSLSTILWTYWVQSVLIGLFQCLKILNLKEFSTQGYTMNGRSVLPNEETKRRSAGFFLLHYGFFHFIYAIFLGGMASTVDTLAVAVAGFAFAVNHLISYRANRERDESHSRNIGSLMFFPYIRIVPMHLIIMIAIPFSGQAAVLVFFLLLKTIADAAMHVFEHRQSPRPVLQ